MIDVSLAELPPLECQKGKFDIPAQVHYLNCAYIGPIPRPVQAAGIGGIQRKAMPYQITSSDFFMESDRARSLFARLLNAADPTRVAIIPSASYGIATAARNLTVVQGQNIIVSAEQFPSNLYTWRKLAQKQGGELRVIEPGVGRSRGETWNARVLDSIDDATAVVALPHVHWTDGTRFDLEAIGERCREVGAAFIVDATQSLGALPLDVERSRPDAVICAAYKWLLGPYSLGLAWYGPRFDAGEPLEENWLARRDSEDFRGLVHYRDEYQPGALRYDMGERSNFILMPMLVAALELILEWQPARIQEYCRTLTRETIAEVVELGFTVEKEAWRGHHLFGLRTPPGLDLDALQAELHRRRIFASLRGSALRIAPNVYNDRDDMDALIAALSRSIRAMNQS